MMRTNRTRIFLVMLLAVLPNMFVDAKVLSTKTYYHRSVHEGNRIGVHFTEFPGEMKDAMWIGPQGTTIAAICADGNLYGSRHFGSSWENWSSDERIAGNVRKIFKLNVGNSKIIVATGTTMYLFETAVGATAIVDPISLTSNGPSQTQNHVFDVVGPHPQLPNIALAEMTDPSCEGTFCNKFLWITGVAGTRAFIDWQYVPLPNVASVLWGNEQLMPVDSFFVIQRPKGMNNFLHGVLVEVPFRSATPTPTTRQIIDKALAIEKIGSFMFVATVVIENLKVRPQLYMSENNFATIVPAKFPRFGGTGGAERGYTVVDAAEAIFINVYRESIERQEQDHNWGTTYISGLHGHRYVPSLNYNRRKDSIIGGTRVDFHRVKGMKGVILANRVLNHYSQKCERCRGERQCEAVCKFGTVITHDNGKTWQPVQPPRGMCQPSSSSENDMHQWPCTLHLHGATSIDQDITKDVYPILTSESAPGLIIASGNVGPHLEVQPGGNRQIFISRDAGETWSLFSRSRHLYGETDYGGLVFLLPLGTPKPYLNFSVDSGNKWDHVLLAESEADASSFNFVFNDIIRPHHHPGAHFAVVFGQNPSNGNSACFYIGLHHTKWGQCRGLSTPDDSSSDYETFTPVSYFSEQSGGPKCLLGETRKYVRKKAGRSCWEIQMTGHHHHSASNTYAVNFTAFSLPVQVKACPCTYDDFECDVGYEEKGYRQSQSDGPSAPTAKDGEQATCVLVDANAKAQEVDEQCTSNTGGMHGFYLSTKGYRRIAGDKCHNGLPGSVNLDPTIAKCANAKGSSGSSGWGGFFKFLLFVLIVGLLVFGCRYLYQTNALFQAMADRSMKNAKAWFVPAHVRRPYQQLARDENDDDHVDDVEDVPNDGEAPAASHNPAQQVASNSTAVEQHGEGEARRKPIQFDDLLDPFGGTKSSPQQPAGNGTMADSPQQEKKPDEEARANVIEMEE